MKKPDYVYVTYIATTPEKAWKALTDIDQMRQTFWAVLLWPLVLLLFPAIAFHDWLKRRASAATPSACLIHCAAI